MLVMEETPVENKVLLDRETVLNNSQCYWAWRRIQDVVLSLLALAVLWLPMLVVALIIVIDSPGASPIYVQTRIGRDGKPFKFYKFRSMRPNAEAELEELLPPRRIIAVLDWQRSNCTTPKAQSICKIFVQCDLLGGHFTPNIETTASGWFALSELPELVEEKSTHAQLELCFRAGSAQVWEPVFD